GCDASCAVPEPSSAPGAGLYLIHGLAIDADRLRLEQAVELDLIPALVELALEAAFGGPDGERAGRARGGGDIGPGELALAVVQRFAVVFVELEAGWFGGRVDVECHRVVGLLVDVVQLRSHRHYRASSDEERQPVEWSLVGDRLTARVDTPREVV